MNVCGIQSECECASVRVCVYLLTGVLQLPLGVLDLAQQPLVLLLQQLLVLLQEAPQLPAQQLPLGGREAARLQAHLKQLDLHRHGVKGQ